MRCLGRVVAAMKRVMRSSGGTRWRVGSLILASVAAFLLVPGTGHESAAAIRGKAVVVANLAPNAAVPAVEIVLSYAPLAKTTMLGGAPLALPISFGRPVAPEDEPTAPPTRWHHKAAHRHGRRWAGDGYFLSAMIVPRMDRVPGGSDQDADSDVPDFGATASSAF
jgi:hypothetical protein